MSGRRLRILRPPLALAVLLAVASGVPFGNEPGAEIDVPHQKFVLDNGLTLIVHEDHKAPIAAVNVWYHVGSKNERPGIERIGGFGGKSDILAMNEVYGGSSELYRTRREWVREAETADLRAAANAWLSDGVYILQVQPTPRYTTRATRIDRSRLPEMGDPPEPRFPALQRATLSSGLEVILAERHAMPVINFDLLIDAGRAADQFATPGTVALTMDMLDEGTTTRDALALSEELALLGAQLGTSSGMDLSSVRFSALTSNLDPSLELFADVVLNPSFPQADFKLRQQQALGGDPARQVLASGDGIARPVRVRLREGSCLRTAAHRDRGLSRQSHARRSAACPHDVAQAEQLDVDRCRRHDA